MKTRTILLSVLGILFVSVAGVAASPGATGKELGNIRLPFLLNQGQIDNHVKFYAKAFGVATYLTKAGEIVYDLPRRESKNATSGWSLTERLVGGAIKSVDGEEKGLTKVSYFLGSDESRWKSDIPAYPLVTMGEVYRGIVFKLRATGESVEKLFYLQPGANPEEIRLRLDGAQSLRTNEKGELEVTTGLGTVLFTKPRAYQKSGEKTEEVEVAYVLKGNSYTFKTGNYDKGRELVIDPLVRSTYLGGNGDDFAFAVAVSNSNIYLGGYTTSTNFPGTAGGAQPAKSGGVFDGVIARLTLDLTTTIQVTYLGGTDTDGINSMAVSGAGVYVAGHTSSNNFPKTTGGAVPYGGGQDGFLALLTPDLTTLTQATYIGGNNVDDIFALAAPVNSLSGYSVFVAGATSSANFPKTAGGFQPAGAGPTVAGGGLAKPDAFVAVFNAGLTSLTQSTYLGGTLEDKAFAMVVSSGFVYVAGSTFSDAFPRASTGAQPFKSFPPSDAFVAYFTTDLTTLVNATYLGGFADENANAIALLGSNVYVAGATESTQFNGTAGGIQPTSGGLIDGFVSVLDSNLSTLIQSTYFGGLGNDAIRTIAIPPGGGAIYVGGVTESPSLPGTTQNTQSSNAGLVDGFVALIYADLKTFRYGTFLGGADVDEVNAIAIDGLDVNVAGSTYSSNFPRTTEGAQVSKGAGSDTFLAKLNFVSPVFLSIVPPITAQPGGSGSTTVTVNSINGFHDEIAKFFVFGQPTVPQLPAGLTVSTNLGPVPAFAAVLPLNGSASTTLTVNVESFVTPGTYTLWIVLDGPGHMNPVPMTVNVVTTIASTSASISTFQSVGCIDDPGLGNALKSQLDAAQKFQITGQARNANNTLRAVTNLLRAQRGKHIATSCTIGTATFDTSAVLISDVESLIQD